MAQHSAVLGCLLILYTLVDTTTCYVSQGPVVSTPGSKYGISSDQNTRNMGLLVKVSLYKRSHRQAAQPKAGHWTDALFVINLILLQAGDLELNPGPRATRFPCGSCNQAVTAKTRGIQCDGCDIWIHPRCIGMESREFRELGNSSAVWFCNHCGLLNISPTLLNYEVETSNLFESLRDSTTGSDNLERNALNSLSPEPSVIGQPRYTSSPRPKKSSNQKLNRHSLKVLNINCQSLPAKKEPFLCLIDQHKPDIIIGTESWLTSQHTDNEFFPTESYSVLRRDRGGDRCGGGVFVAAKNDLILVREDTLETNCELLWCSLKLASSKTLFIGAYYRPHEGDAESLAELELSLSRFNSDHTILLAGDFNFPGWKWTESKVTDCNFPSLHYQFGDLLDSKGMTQLIEEPTRNTNIRDLVLTNNPTLVSEVTVVPGISDHDCPFVNLYTKVTQRRKLPKRKIPQYHKAKWEQFSDHMKCIGEDIMSKEDSLSVNEMWLLLSDGL